MKLFNKKPKQEKVQVVATNANKGGTYAITLTAIVFAILLVINMLVSILPSSMTTFDISSAKLYSVTSATKVVVNALEKDVTIYWITQADEEDSVIENLLSKYDSLSEHLTVEKKNPDVYPTFTSSYTSEDVPNNSLIVECGDKYRYISYDDIYLTEANYTTMSYDQSFDGEGAITSAIDYVVSDDLPKIYVLQGHGEVDLSSSFTTQLDKDNIETETFSLLNEDEVPEDADCILIYAPSTDISEEEAEILTDYVDEGGKLLVIAGPVEEGTLDNLYSVLSNYGVEANEGIVIENDRNYYAFQSPYILLPEIESDSITDPLIEESYYAIVPIAQGLTINSTSKATVTSLLSTSSTSFSKIAGYDLTTYEKEDDDIDGPFSIGVKITTNSDGQIIWYSSSYLLDDRYNSYSSGANLDLVMNSVSSLIGEREAIAIRSKSLSYSYLTISDSTASLMKTMMIFVLPLGVLALGIIVVVNRRRANHE